MYNQYVAGDLIYSRIYQEDPPKNAAPTAAEGVETKATPQAAAIMAEPATQETARSAVVPRTEKNAGLTGILDELGLGGIELPLLLLLLFSQKGAMASRSPLFLGLLLLGFDKWGSQKSGPFRAL